MRKIKISKVVFFFTLMIFVTLAVLYIASTIQKKEPVVSLRQEYQTRLEQEGNR